jgi:hypothetical protein
MSLQAQAERGLHAARILNDPMVAEAFALVRQAIIERWESCPLADKDGAHELRLQLHLLASVKANFEEAISDGKVAMIELEREKAEAARKQSPADFRTAYLRR